MLPENLIALKAYCNSHNIKLSFISLLQQTGLIEIITLQDAAFIEADQLRFLEKIIRFYFDLDINLEGIEAITHLLERIHTKEEEITELKNKLRFYESQASLENEHLTL